MRRWPELTVKKTGCMAEIGVERGAEIVPMRLKRKT